MDNKWVIFAVTLWMIGMFLGATFDKVDIGTYSPGGTPMTTTFNYLTNMKNIAYSTDATGASSFVGVNTNYFKVLWQMMTFDFGFFYGGAEIFRWIFLVPISVGILFAVYQLFVQIIQGLISAFIP